MLREKPIPEEITQTYFDEHDGEAILPPAEKQITDFFLMFADASLFPGHNVRHGTSAITRRCWVPQASIEYMYRLHESAGRIDVIGASSDYVKLRLSSLGWEYYRDLTGGGSLSNRAFMAMKFDDQELNTALIEIFKPAAQAAGFELNPVNDNSEPGLIDLRIRNAIRRSRIVFADLTHSNQGVYWEAGFAEGYGIPVVYLCKEVKWNAEKTHFDVNHCTHILWDPKNPGKCKDEMTQLLRNLFPEDARLEDS